MHKKLAHVPGRLVKQAVLVPWPAAVVLPLRLQQVGDRRLAALVFVEQRGESGRWLGNGAHVLERNTVTNACLDQPHQRLVDVGELLELIEVYLARDSPRS